MFWTPFGSYRYPRMPQEISSAQEEYQCCWNEEHVWELKHDGVEVIADDILCYDSRESMEEALADHDRTRV